MEVLMPIAIILCFKRALAFTTLCTLSLPVYAYIDPGTGSMVLQIIIASVVAGLATARYWWDRLLSLLGIHKKIDSSDTNKVNESENNESTDKNE